MELLEYQLDDVRRAVEDYHEKHILYESETERQALRDLVERIVEISQQRTPDGLGPLERWRKWNEGVGLA